MDFSAQIKLTFWPSVCLTPWRNYDLML